MIGNDLVANTPACIIEPVNAFGPGKIPDLLVICGKPGIGRRGIVIEDDQQLIRISYVFNYLR